MNRRFHPFFLILSLRYDLKDPAACLPLHQPAATVAICNTRDCCSLFVVGTGDAHLTACCCGTDATKADRYDSRSRKGSRCCPLLQLRSLRHLGTEQDERGVVAEAARLQLLLPVVTVTATRCATTTTPSPISDHHHHHHYLIIVSSLRIRVVSSSPCLTICI